MKRKNDVIIYCIMQAIMELLILLLFLSVLLGVFKSNIKGYFGEKAVAIILSALPKQRYILVNDLILQTEYGTTQIDHVVISVYGIFVIETKNYKGWIFGNEYGEQWTKNMYGKKFSFRNPLKQNYAHVKALQEKMNLPENKFISIVAFSGSCEIKVKTNKHVIYIGQLKRIIQTYNEVVFREDELAMLEYKIKSADINTRETKKQHVDQVRSIVKNDRERISQGICTKCGSKLITRNGKYGSFVGCSNYPKCRFTQNLR